MDGLFLFPEFVFRLAFTDRHEELMLQHGLGSSALDTPNGVNMAPLLLL